MKMMKSILLLLMPLCFLSAPQAQAEGLLANSCVSLPESQSLAVVHQINLSDEVELFAYRDAEVIMAAIQSTAFGLTCKDIRAIDSAAYVVDVAITPALTAMVVPSVRTAMAMELAGLGLVVGSPAIATATIIGGFGIVTYKVLMKVSLEKCAEQDRENLKRELFHEFEVRYGARPTPQTTLNISK